jgi:hypothetical protein
VAERSRAPRDEAPRPSRATRTSEEAEAALAAYWSLYVDADRPGARFVLTHWRASLDALAAIRSLPVLTARPRDTPGGRSVRRVLDTRASYGVPARLLGSAVLEVPEDGDSFTEGRRAATLRRKIRAAEKLGVKMRRVEDERERAELLARANAAEQAHRDLQYRVEAPDNDDLLLHEVWMTADDQDGHPLLLAVAPTDQEFATLRYFRTLGSGDAQSDARYLATAALVSELSHHGVRHLLDTATPPEQTNGLRHFQRMVGFRYQRIRLVAS